MSGKRTAVAPPRLPRLIRPLRAYRKPASALPISPLAISHIQYACYPLRPKYRGSLPEAGDGQSLASTRSSSASLKAAVREEKTFPECGASAWAISNGKTGELLGGKQENSPREIASLTKIMTCYLSILLLRNFEDLSLDSPVTVSDRAAHMSGTSACLRPGDRLTIRDLLFALMLPSGNDAAQCLAEFFGYFLALRSGADPTIRLDKHFIREMNELAGALDLTQTFYRNPHGMSININISTAKDVNILASAAMKSLAFRTIVGCPMYTCHILGVDGTPRCVTWENTNRLLHTGFEGVKTGSTDAAGPCLCSSFYDGKTRVIVTLLGARGMEERWTDAPRLTWYGLERLPSSRKKPY